MQTLKEAIAQNLTFTQWFKQSGHHIERKNRYQLQWEREQDAVLQDCKIKKLSLIVVDEQGFPLNSYKAESFIIHPSLREATAFGVEHFGKFKFQILNYHTFKKSKIAKYIERRNRCLARIRQFKA